MPRRSSSRAPRDWRKSTSYALRVKAAADLRITPEVREDHASYIHNWLQVLKDDKRAVFTAASHASKAVDFLHGLQPLV